MTIIEEEFIPFRRGVIGYRNVDGFTGLPRAENQRSAITRNIVGSSNVIKLIVALHFLSAGEVEGHQQVNPTNILIDYAVISGDLGGHGDHQVDGGGGGIDRAIVPLPVESGGAVPVGVGGEDQVAEVADDDLLVGRYRRARKGQGAVGRQ